MEEERRGRGQRPLRAGRAGQQWRAAQPGAVAQERARSRRPIIDARNKGLHEAAPNRSRDNSDDSDEEERFENHLLSEWD